MNYYSPELVSYIQGTGNAADLTTASDMFALGLIYSEYLTGALPAFDPAYHEAAIAVLNGTKLRLPAGHAPASVADLVERMLLGDHRARPRVGEVHASLMGLRSETPTTGRPPFPAGTATVGRTSRRLRAPSPAPAPRPTTGTARPGRTTAASDRAVPSPPSALRGKGLRTGSDATRPPAPGSAAGSAAGEPVSGPPTAEPAADRGRALLGKLIRRIEERRSR
jgi:serine/threonine protein kinase